ncbi:MAG: lysophospholipid acyltransferase family protein [Anaerovoracaceae bacterium]
MKTIIWLIKAVIYLISAVPDMKKAGKLRELGDMEAFYKVVDNRVRDFAKAMLKNAGVTVEVHGQENFTGVPAVIMANHQSDFDIPILLAYMDKPYGMVAKMQLRSLPLVRTWMEYIGCSFIDRSDARQSIKALNQAGEQLPLGRSVVIFPEGKRSRSDDMDEFGSGAFKVAFKHKAPVIPVAIDGSYKILEANSGKWIRPGHVILTVLPAIETADMDKQEQRALPERVRAEILAAREASRASYKTNSL